MGIKRAILRWVYPFLKLFSANSERGNIIVNKADSQPSSSFYNLKAIDNKESVVDFVTFRGKKVLIVNTASDCGYTGQYSELQKLHENFGNKVVILGFPSNDFNQEKGTDEEISAFCDMNYRISFIMMKKSHVTIMKDQNEIYSWLTKADKNGWNNYAPNWNFSKYLINECGTLTHYFGSAVSPMDRHILDAMEL
jgi:glutathione peroxidase